MRETKSFGLEYTDIEALLSQPHYFVDKSLFIKHWMESPIKINVVLRPRLFGKSLALSMLRTYFDYRHFPGPGFKLLQINDGEHDVFYAKYAQQYAVIVLDWRAGRVLRASSMKDFKCRLRGYLQSVFLDQINLLGVEIKEVNSWFEKSFMGRDFKLSDFFDDQPLAASVKLLAALVHFISSVSEKSAMVLIDDYDDVLAKAGELAKSAEEYREIEAFFEDFYFEAFERGSGLRVCIFGVHRLASNAPFSRILAANPRLIFFHEHTDDTEPFARDFGFTLEETEQAMRVLGVQEFHAEELNLYYQLQAGGKRDMLHPYSVAAAIKYRQQDDYWVRKSPLNFAAYPFSRSEEWGVGDMGRFASHYLRQRYQEVVPQPVGFDPSQRATAGQVVQFLIEEGFLRPNFSLNLSREICNYFDLAWVDWLDQQTGIIEALRELHHHRTEGIRRALQSIIDMPHFYRGRPLLDPSCPEVHKSLFDDLLGHVFDVHLNFFGEFELVSREDPRQLLFVYVGVVEGGPTEYTEFMRRQTERVRKSKHNNGLATVTIIAAVILQADGSIRITNDQLEPVVVPRA
jgi:hypothetical protein